MQFVSREPRGFPHRVLGPVAAARNGEEVILGGEERRVVFAMLVGSAGHAIDRDVMLGGGLGEAATDSKRASLHGHVSNLRALPGLEISHTAA